MRNARIQLEAGGCYHIYNHAVGKDSIFRNDENYEFFLRKLSTRILPFADIYAYCLMVNHFHFVLRIKQPGELMTLWPEKIKAPEIKPNEPWFDPLVNKIIVNEFACMFNSYVQAYNHQYNRQGALLKESFQRKNIDDSLYLIRLICYVNNNPVNDGFVTKPGDWKYSSYNSTLSDKPTKVAREAVLELFGGKEKFLLLHKKYLGDELD
jgi:putative transposase